MGSTKPAYVEVPGGSVVFKEGDVGGELYIIESGQVELIPRSGAALAMLGAGDFLGEMALLGKQPHTATALARTNTRLLRIEVALLADILAQNGAIGASLLRQLAARALRTEQRLREIDIELAALKTEVARLKGIVPDQAHAMAVAWRRGGVGCPGRSVGGGRSDGFGTTGSESG